MKEKVKQRYEKHRVLKKKQLKNWGRKKYIERTCKGGHSEIAEHIINYTMGSS